MRELQGQEAWLKLQGSFSHQLSSRECHVLLPALAYRWGHEGSGDGRTHVP